MKYYYFYISIFFLLNSTSYHATNRVDISKLKNPYIDNQNRFLGINKEQIIKVCHKLMFTRLFGLIALFDCVGEKIKDYPTTQDTKITHPELYEVFLKIKKDLGITENIRLYITHSSNHSWIEDTYAAYIHVSKSILLNDDLLKEHPSEIIFVIAHELEHVRQCHKYPGSYHPPKNFIERYNPFSKNYDPTKLKTTVKVENGADASAAGYFDCPECLKRIVNTQEKNLLEYIANNEQNNPNTKLNPEDFSSVYFSPEDYKIYIDRALLDGRLCRAHQLTEKSKSVFLNWLNWLNLLNKKQYHDFEKLDLQLFLPQLEEKHTKDVRSLFSVRNF